ncbi:unnamed protein product [Clonostachys solani]|uniref:Uncharacterized protein n=1 Tax=Clonostachys solani TaxID=160281 RepID=A0A9N9VZM8_9HYPO|nr:unnamed protein product [Clonostachys solani]
MLSDIGTRLATKVTTKIALKKAGLSSNSLDFLEKNNNNKSILNFETKRSRRKQLEFFDEKKLYKKDRFDFSQQKLKLFNKREANPDEFNRSEKADERCLVRDKDGRLRQDFTERRRRVQENKALREQQKKQEEEDEAKAKMKKKRGKKSHHWLDVPLTMQPWLTAPASYQIRPLPTIGESAPKDPMRKLRLGGGRRTLVVFLRCVGCAFARETFQNLRELANRSVGTIRCVAVSHSSREATERWIGLMGGRWLVDIVIDEDRALYSAWGLGLGDYMYMFHPAAQMHSWKHKGWLGSKVASTMYKRSADSRYDDESDEVLVMGSKWQEAGVFAVDGTGKVIWGVKAQRSDDTMDLEMGARLLCA